MKLKWILIVVLIISIIFQVNASQPYNDNTNSTSTNASNPMMKVATSLTTLSLDDSNIASYASSGNGTSTNPYIVTDYVITNSGASNGLVVSNLNSYYVTIRNFNITTSTQYGIYVVNSSHITFDTIQSYSNAYGMVLDQNSQFITIINSQMYTNTYDGINVVNSGNITVDTTTCYSNGQVGVYVSYSGDVNINNGNYSYNGNSGAVITGSGSNNIIQNNYLNHNAYAGGYLYQTAHASIISNFANFDLTGIVVSLSNDSIISKNIVVNNTDGLEINGALNNNFNTNYILNNTIGVYVYGVSMNNIIQDNGFDSSSNYDISVVNGSNNQISANAFNINYSSDQKIPCISITGPSNGNTITGNNFYANENVISA